MTIAPVRAYVDAGLAYWVLRAARDLDRVEPPERIEGL